jgi:hypothetical protein
MAAMRISLTARNPEQFNPDGAERVRQDIRTGARHTCHEHKTLQIARR